MKRFDMTSITDHGRYGGSRTEMAELVGQMDVLQARFKAAFVALKDQP